jgi:pimeloyl-ACP methyl ester carboxylesterase
VVPLTMDIDINGHRCVYELTGPPRDARLFIQESGGVQPAGGPHLTLLHSVGLSTREGWRNQVAVLAKHFTVLTFDFRGLGQSGRGDGPLGVETFRDDLEALLAALGIKRTAVMGLSLGGFVAQAFALKRPDLVSALVLVSTTSRIFAGNAERRAERNRRIRESGMAVAAAHQIESHFPPAFAAANPEVCAWYERHYLANDPESYIAIMDDLGRFDVTARLGEIRCPTLIVAGDEDATSVAGRAPLDSARILHAGIRGSRLEVIAGANHYPQLDHAAEFNQRVLEFLRETVCA